MSKTRELLADQAHIMWAHWMRYMFSQCSGRFDEDGKLDSALIPSDKCARWRRLLETPYAELTEAERESDREQADRQLAALAESGLAIVPVEPTKSGRKLYGYYYGFDPTGVDCVDAILEAVGRAGKMAHNTADWNDAAYADGVTAIDLIQNAANDLAAMLSTAQEPTTDGR